MNCQGVTAAHSHQVTASAITKRPQHSQNAVAATPPTIHISITTSTRPRSRLCWRLPTSAPTPTSRASASASASASAASIRFGRRSSARQTYWNLRRRHGGVGGGGGGGGLGGRISGVPNDPSWTTADYSPSGGWFGPEEELALVSFHIPVASPATDPDDVVTCPDIREKLIPRDSPLLSHDNFGGGFVDDEDRIALNTMRLSSVASSGATDMCVDLPESGLMAGPDGGARALAWPVTRPVPASPGPEGYGGGGGGDDNGGGPGRHAASAATRIGGGQQGLRPSYLYSAPPRPPSQQGISAVAARVPAVNAPAAAAFAALAQQAPGGGLGGPSGGSVQRHLHNVSTLADRVCVSLPSWAMRGGPRKRIYFEPYRVSAAIVTCGHICPGVNDVVQAIVHRLTDYGVPEGQVLGICDGFKGFDPRHPAKPRPLTRHVMEGAHLRGGSMLGTSKGWADIDAVVAKIAMWEVNHLYVIGGDGGLRAAQLISEQCRARDLPCCVVGVPKSIENDILLVDRTFGFETAVQEVQRPLLAAKVEASSIRGGIGLVKVMGRHSGFLAMQASLASGVVDVCLIPEVSFTMDGPHGLLSYLGTVLERKGHAVVCVAEGAGQDLISAHTPLTKDLLGNPVLHDIGVYLKARFKMHFKDMAEVRYIDPTYMIRTTPCNSVDHIYARVLAHNAVDAAFSGYTGVTVGMCNNHHVLLPIPLVVQAPRRVDPWGMAWNRLRADSGQPSFHPPPSLGRAAISSATSSESDTEGPPSPFTSMSEGCTSTPSLSPTSSVTDISTTSVVAAIAAAAADAAAAEGGGGEKGRSPSPTAAPPVDEPDVMTWMGSEPTGPQDTMSPAAAAGSHGLYGGGEAISPPVEPADVTGEQLHVLATYPVQADLPWPAPPHQGPFGTGTGGGSVTFDSCGTTESGGEGEHSSVDLEVGQGSGSSPQAAASTVAAAGDIKGEGREEVAPSAAAANTPSQSPTTPRSFAPPDSTVSRTGQQGECLISQGTQPRGGPLEALGAVLRSVAGVTATSGGGGGGGVNGSAGPSSSAGAISGSGHVRKDEVGGDMQRQGDGGEPGSRRAASGVPPPPPPPSPRRTSGSHRRLSPKTPVRADDDSE